MPCNRGEIRGTMKGNRMNAGRLAMLIGMLLMMVTVTLPAQTDDDDIVEEDDGWDTVDVEDPDVAPDPGSFGVFGGPAFEFSMLKTADLDPALDETLFMSGGFGYAIVAHWILGGGGVGVTLENPNDAYDRFSFGYGGFLTGYDLEFNERLNARLALLVGGGGLSMIKKRTDLSPLGDNEFLERYREEEFFLIRSEASVGVKVIPFIELRLAGAYIHPLGGGDVADLRHFSAGLHLMFGFRNNIFVE